jgi:ribosomal protein S17E
MDDERAHVVKVTKDKSDKFKNRLEGILTKLSRLEAELGA